MKMRLAPCALRPRSAMLLPIVLLFSLSTSSSALTPTLLRVRGGVNNRVPPPALSANVPTPTLLDEIMQEKYGGREATVTSSSQNRSMCSCHSPSSARSTRSRRRRARRPPSHRPSRRSSSSTRRRALASPRPTSCAPSSSRECLRRRSAPSRQPSSQSCTRSTAISTRAIRWAT